MSLILMLITNIVFGATIFIYCTGVLRLLNSNELDPDDENSEWQWINECLDPMS